MNYILQADVPPGGTVALVTKDILKPGIISRIILPAAPEGEGWFEVRFAVCKRKFLGPVKPSEVKDVTEELTGAEMVYLPKEQTEFPCDLFVNRFYWWFVIFLKNRMLDEKFITCQVEVEYK